MDQKSEGSPLSPAEKHVPAVSKWGRTRLQFNEFDYTWVVENFEFCRHRELGYRIKSPKFISYNHNDKFDWQLIVWPHGHSTPENLSLDLVRISSPKHDTDACVKLSIVDGSCAELFTYEKFVTIDQREEAIISVEKFAESSDVFERALTNSNLTLKCRILFDNGLTECDSDGDPDAAAAMRRMHLS